MSERKKKEGRHWSTTAVDDHELVVKPTYIAVYLLRSAGHMGTRNKKVEVLIGVGIVL